MNTIVVTGTDTGIGKTVFSAGLVDALHASYWKPVQSGMEEETDSQIVARLSGRPVLPEGYFCNYQPRHICQPRPKGLRLTQIGWSYRRWMAYWWPKALAE